MTVGLTVSALLGADNNPDNNETPASTPRTTSDRDALMQRLLRQAIDQEEDAANNTAAASATSSSPATAQPATSTSSTTAPSRPRTEPRPSRTTGNAVTANTTTSETGTSSSSSETGRVHPRINPFQNRGTGTSASTTSASSTANNTATGGSPTSASQTNANVAGQVANASNESPLRIVPQAEPRTNGAAIPHTFNFPNSPLEPIFEMFTELTGKMVLYSPEVTGTVNLISGSVELTRQEAIEAITSSLALSGIVLTPLGDKFVKAVPVAEAIQHAPQVSAADDTNLPESGEFITRTVQLDQVKPSEAVEILRPLTKNPDGLIPIDSSQTLLIHSDAVTMKQMLEVLKSVDVVPEFDYNLEVIPIRYSKVTDLYNTMESLISGTANTGGAAGGQFGGAGGGQFGGFGGNSRGGFGGNSRGGFGTSSRGGFNSGFNSGFGGGFGGNSFGGGYRPFQASRTQTSTAGNRSNFQDRLRQVIDRAATEDEVELLSQARIVPDLRSNSLLIFANKQDLTMITNMVSKVDHLLAQVLIEAIVLEIGLGDDLNLGVSLGQNPETSGKFIYGGAINNPNLTNSNPLGSANDFLSGSLTNAIPGGFSYFGRYDDTLNVAFSAIATDSSVRVVSRPRIQTSHAVPGYFFLGETVPYVSGSNVGGFSNFAQSVVQQLRIGIDLEVIPYITPEGYVVMDITQNVDQRGQDVIIDGNPIPVVNQRQAAATLSVRDGDTIMLGGFIRQSKNKSRSGVPILKDIPLLGAAFRSKSDTNDRTELIILLRATVLETPEEAALVATRERQDIDGIRQMEEDFEAERLGKQKKKKRRWGR